MKGLIKIQISGIGSCLAALMGVGTGVTTYAENIALMHITRVSYSVLGFPELSLSLILSLSQSRSLSSNLNLNLSLSLSLSLNLLGRLACHNADYRLHSHFGRFVREGRRRFGLNSRRCDRRPAGHGHGNDCRSRNQ